jgi:hypothetical protein
MQKIYPDVAQNMILPTIFKPLTFISVGIIYKFIEQRNQQAEIFQIFIVEWRNEYDTRPTNRPINRRPTRHRWKAL